MSWFIIGIFSVYCVFRAFLDSQHIKNVESIEQSLREINESLHSIKMRFKREKDDPM